MPKRRKRSKRGGRTTIGAALRGLRLGILVAMTVTVVGALWGVFVGGHGPTFAARLNDAAEWTLKTAGFAVRDVTVSGRRYTKPQEILQALDVSRGDAITSFDPVKARERVLELHWVRDARVMRLLPDTIHVEIEEHAPFAIWQRSSGAALINDRGEIVTGFDIADFPRLPVIVGPGAAGEAPGFLAALSARPSLGRRVRAAVRVGERRWTLKLDSGIDVLLPEKDVEVALDELIRIDERTGLLERDLMRIDMRLADRLTVLPRSRNGAGPGQAWSATFKFSDRST